MILFALFAPAAMAALVTTINFPPSDTYNNLSANVKTIDINFTITDTNQISFDTNGDYNVNITYYPTTTGKLWNSGTGNDANITYVVRDGNINDWNRNGNGTKRCTGISSKSIKCRYLWTIPVNTVMGDGDWTLDINVFEFGKGPADYTNSDDNDSVTMTIQNHLSNANSIRSLMGIVAMVLAALVLIGGLFSIAVLKTDVAQTAIMTVAAAVAAAIAALIIGGILAGL
jgi:hypothetical protein